MINIGKEVFKLQAKALERAANLLDAEFEEAVNLILETRGRLIICGIGKSGIIGRKISATLASTGTPSFFVHPAEAYHGDLGMFTCKDSVLLISYSGETDEVIRLIPTLKKIGTKIISFVGDKKSSLAKYSDIVLDVSVEKEACPNNLAPTTSTTTALVMGDALAVALIDQKGFLPQDFAVYHPGGSLGRRLLTQVKDMMHPNYPKITPDAPMSKVIMDMTNGGLGLVVVMSGEKNEGVITDGDLRRALTKHDNLLSMSANEIMTTNPLIIEESVKFSEAEELMLQEEVTALLVTDEHGKITGVLKLLDARAL